jgi:hypothetical protein
MEELMQEAGRAGALEKRTVKRAKQNRNCSKSEIIENIVAARKKQK